MEFTNVELLLSQISSKSVLELALELLKCCDFEDKQSLQIVAEKIYENAVKSERFCLKYVELVKELSELHEGGYKVEKDETFKDIFIKYAIGSIKVFRQSLIRDTTALFPFEQTMIEFFCYLYTTGLITSALMLHWINFLEASTNKDLWSSIRDIMFKAIKQKVIEDAEKPSLQNSCQVMKKMIETNVKPSDVSSKSLTTRENQQKLSPIASVISIKSGVIEAFRKSLSNAQPNIKIQFDFRDMAACCNDDKRKCARILLDQALESPNNVEMFADLLRTFITQPTTKPFMKYFTELCNANLNLFFKNRQEYLSKIKNLGLFLSEIFVREGLKLDVVRKWLQEVNKMLDEDIEAIPILLSSLKIMLKKMKTRDPPSFKACIQNISNLMKKKQIPPDYMLWTSKLLTDYEESEGKSASLIADSPASGSVYATSQPKSQAVIREKSRNGIIKDDFMFILRHIRTLTELDFERLRAYNDKERRRFANILLNFVVAYPYNKHLYADIVKDTLSVFSPDSNNTKPLVKHVSEICEKDFNKIFWEAIPSQSSQWSHCIQVGAFVCELYMRNSINSCVLNNWLDGLHQMVPKDIEATKVFLGALKVTFTRMKEIEPTRHVTYIYLLQTLMSQQLIPKRFKQWTNNALSQNNINVVPVVLANSLMEAERIPTNSTAARSGAIRKTLLGTINISQQIIESFQKLLVDLRGREKITFDYKLLETCDEKTLQGCAMIFFEHVLLHPSQVAFFVAAIKHVIFFKINESQLSVFVDHLCEQIKAEITSSELADPGKADWERIKNVGALLCELDNFTISPGKLLLEWRNFIYQMLLVDYEPALEALLLLVKRVAATMKERNPDLLKEFTDYVQNLLRTQIVPESSQELIRDLKFKNILFEAQPQAFFSFAQLQNILVRLELENQGEILREIIALKIPPSEVNLKEIANTIISRAMQKFELIKSSVDVLAKLPQASIPPFNNVTFSGQIKLVIIKLLGQFFARKISIDDEIVCFMYLVREMKDKSVILIDHYNGVLRYLTATSLGNKVRVEFPLLDDNGFGALKSRLAKKDDVIKKTVFIKQPLDVIADKSSVHKSNSISEEKDGNEDSEALRNSKTENDVSMKQSFSTNPKANLTKIKIQPEESLIYEKPSFANQVEAQQQSNNPFEQLQKIVVRLELANQKEILKEIVALSISPTEVNLKKIANTIIARAKHKFELTKCFVDVLAELPQSSNPPFNEATFSGQVKFVIMKSFDQLIARKTIIDEEVVRLMYLVRELKSKSVIWVRDYHETLRYLTATSLGKKIRDEFVHMDGKNSEVLHNRQIKESVTIDQKVDVIVTDKLSDHKPPAVIESMSIKQGFCKNLQASSIDTKPQETLNNTNQTPFVKLVSYFSDTTTRSIAELTQIFHDLDFSKPARMGKIVRTIYDFAKKQKKFRMFAQISRLIENTARPFQCKLLVKLTVRALMGTELNALLPFDNMKIKTINELSQFHAELFRVGLLDSEDFFKMLDSLLEQNLDSDIQLEMFQVSLQIALPAMIKINVNEKCQYYLCGLKSRKELYANIRLYLIWHDVVETLESITSSSNQVPEPNTKSEIQYSHM